MIAILTRCSVALVVLLATLVLVLHSNEVRAMNSRIHVNVGVMDLRPRAAHDLALGLLTTARGAPPGESDVFGSGSIRYAEFEGRTKRVAEVIFEDAETRDFGAEFIALQGLDAVVVAVERGLPSQARLQQQCLAIKAARVPKVFVFVSGEVDGSGDSSEAMETFARCGYASADIRVVHGTGTTQGVDSVASSGLPALRDALDAEVMPRPMDRSTPFALPIEDVFNIQGRGTIVTGRVASGEARVGSRLIAIGRGKEKGTSAADIEMFRRKLTMAVAGDNVGITLSGVGRQDVVRGMILAAPGIARQERAFHVALEFADEGVLGGPPGECMLFTGTEGVPVRARFLSRHEAMIEAGDPIAIITGWPFVLRRHDTIVAVGAFGAPPRTTNRGWSLFSSLGFARNTGGN